MRKILAELLIVARDQNKVFVEPASSRKLSAADAREKYQLALGKGAAYVEFDVEAESVQRMPNPRTKWDEDFIVGDVDLTNRNLEAFFNF